MIKYRLYVAILLLLFGCRNSSSSGKMGSKGSPDVNTTVSQHTNTQLTYNLFIENSPSMDGYVKDNETEFKTTLSTLVSDIAAKLNTNPTVSFINEGGVYRQSLPLNGKASSSVMELNPQKMSNNRGHDTQIDNIINECMNRMDSNINILTSDCIFSKRNSDHTMMSPIAAENNLKEFIAKKLNNTNIATIILKYSSTFSGTYFSETNGDKGIQVSKIHRPFYVLIFGEADNIQPLLSKINFRQYPVFEESYCLISNHNNQEKIKTAISGENRSGSNYSIQIPASDMVVYNAVQDVNGIFRFSFHADLSKIPAEKSFLANPFNYKADNNFEIDSIIEVNNQPDYTHIFRLRTDQLLKSQNIKFGLKYEPPNWVSKTGSKIDNNPTDTTQQDQTYGFTQLINGISQAYQNNDSLQFAINIKVSQGKINSGSSGFPWWILIVVMAVVGIIIWLKNKS